jgi:hypothetical protein
MSAKHRTRDTSKYESPDGFSTVIWGPSVWHFLHTMSFNFPVHPTEDDKTAYMNFMISLGHVLPCRICREHYRDNLRVAEFSRGCFTNRHTLSRFVYKLHNIVNTAHTGKPLSIGYTQLRDNYESFRAKCVDGKGCIRTPVGQVKSRAMITIAPVTAYPNRCSFHIDDRCRGKRPPRPPVSETPSPENHGV